MAQEGAGNRFRKMQLTLELDASCALLGVGRNGATRRERILELCEAGTADPFRNVSVQSAYRTVAERRDLPLLLRMAAKPGAARTRRFLVSADGYVAVPVEGRDDIPSSVHSPDSDYGYFLRGRGTTIEGIEALLLFGYRLHSSDIQGVCRNHVQPEERRIRAVKFCLAAHPSYVLPDRHCLESSIESFGLLRVLLQAGADPNLSLRQNTHFPLLAAALSQRPPRDDVIRLLFEYGADPSSNYEVRRGRFRSIEELAALRGKSELLSSEVTRVTANPEAYIRILRREFTRTLRQLTEEENGIILVAFMRATGGSVIPQKGLVSKKIRDFCPPGNGFDLWELE